MRRPINLNPSSAAWALGRMIVSDTNSGCLRFLLLKREFPQPDIPEHLKVMGEKGEEAYMARLIEEQEHPFHRELPLKADLEGVKVRGRMDFVTYHDKFKVVHECKTSQSKSFLYQVVRKGEPKINHLAQLVFYLTHLNEIRGKLVCLYAPTNEVREFKVVIQPDGSILVDKRLYTFNVRDQITHQLLAAQVIKEEIIWDRPRGKACDYCPFKAKCEKYDAAGCGNTLKEFLEVTEDV